MMKILASIGFSIGAVACLALSFMTYISKKKTKGIQNTFFLLILLFCTLSCFAEFFYVYCISGHLSHNIIIFSCLLFIFFMIFSMYFTICYVIIIRTANLEDKKRKPIRYLLIFSVLILYLFCFYMAVSVPLTIHEDFLYQFDSSGTENAISICYVVFFIFVLVLFVKNDTLSRSHKLPLLYAILVIILVLTIQLIFGYDFNNHTFLLSFLLIAIYFTTENQDFKLLEELEESMKEADVSNEAQTKFLENISHAIRSPMNTILGFSETLLVNNDSGIDKIKEEVSDIYTASQYFKELTNNISDISQIESEKVTIVEKEYDLGDIVGEINEAINYKKATKEIDFSIKVSEYLPRGYFGDRSKIIKIITNILTNAIYYTESGNISLNITEIKRMDKKITLSFSITNPGTLMKEEDFDRDIQDFLEAKSSFTVNDIMLELMVAKKLANMLDGDIEFSSSPEAGTRYDFNISQMIVNSDTIGNIDYNSKVDSNTQEVQKRVLFIGEKEDSLTIGILKKSNLLVDDCLSIENYKDSIISNKYSFIFVDYHAPKDITELLQELSSMECTLPPVVALISGSDEQSKDKYISEGFTDFLVKPISTLDIEMLIQKYFDDKEQTSDSSLEVNV